MKLTRNSMVRWFKSNPGAAVDLVLGAKIIRNGRLVKGPANYLRFEPLVEDSTKPLTGRPLIMPINFK